MRNFGLSVPGKLTPTSWELPSMSEEDWITCGLCLAKIEGAVQWWLGDWWAHGEHAYGQRKALFDPGGPLADMNYQTCHVYGWVARSVETINRLTVLEWKHHFCVASFPAAQQRKWLARALKEGWSANQLKAAIARQAAIDRTQQIEFEAGALGKFAVLYADPPWQYEYPPIGASNRSIENHYPTMTLAAICALPVNDIMHEDAVLLMWATSPKLYECMKVLDAWGLQHRTTAVWVKDKIGMGYHFRERHEILLVAKRGELPPPVEDARPDSVIEAPRLEHSAKPPVVYDLIDRMYPVMRKIELFGRNCEGRALWTFWGNQAAQTEAA